MRLVFADTLFFVALINRRDSLHTKALDWATRQRPRVVTTEFVLLEVANFFKHPKDRSRFVAFVDELDSDSATTVIACESDLFRRGLTRFASRLDKEWSLTDCISFVVMEEHGLTDALTDDPHFEQAGFTVLL
jgi:uncharacterized protein